MDKGELKIPSGVHVTAGFCLFLFLPIHLIQYDCRFAIHRHSHTHIYCVMCVQTLCLHLWALHGAEIFHLCRTAEPHELYFMYILPKDQMRAAQYVVSASASRCDRVQQSRCRICHDKWSKSTQASHATFFSLFFVRLLDAKGKEVWECRCCVMQH